MRKLNIIVPVLAIAAVGIAIALQAPTIKEYMSDTDQLEARLEKCLTTVAEPHNDQRCINASIAATHQWEAEMSAAINVLNKKNTVVKALVASCAKPSCYAKITQTPQSQELDAAKEIYQKILAAKPPNWAAS